MKLTNYYHIGDVAKIFDLHPNTLTMMANKEEYSDAFLKIGKELFINLDPFKMGSGDYLTTGLRKSFKEHKSDLKHLQSLDSEEEKKEFAKNKKFNIKDKLAFKDWSGRFPLTAFKDELDLTNEEIDILEKNKNITIKENSNRDGTSSFKYVEYGPTLVKIVNDNDVLYKVTKKEYDDYVENGTAKGHIELDDKYVLMWY